MCVMLQAGTALEVRGSSVREFVHSSKSAHRPSPSIVIIQCYRLQGYVQMRASALLDRVGKGITRLLSSSCVCLLPVLGIWATFPSSQ
jgi:hypothetical protein